MPGKEHILIAGGGIGGLAAACCLVSRGYSVSVFEQAPELAEIGAGIQISANSTKVLIDLGLADALQAVSVVPKGFIFRMFSTGEELQRIPLGETHLEKHGAPYYHIHRADIHNILASKLNRLDPDCVHLNATVEGFEESESDISVRLSDGQKFSGDILVGADGIKSVVSSQIRGAESPNYTGQVAWRAIVPTDKLPENFMDTVATVWAGPRRHIVMYYLRKGELVNFVGCTQNPDWTDESWTVKAPWEELKADFAGWHDDIQTYIDQVEPDQCFRWALNNRIPRPGWSKGRATIMGDAAHATLPYLAQGANMAIEDAAILGRMLDEFNTLPVQERLNKYESARFERTKRIVEESTSSGKLYQQPSEEDLRTAFAARDLAGERNEWLYSYDPLTVPLS